MTGLPVFLTPDRQTVLIVGSTPAAMAKLALVIETGVTIRLVGCDIKAAVRSAGLENQACIVSIEDRAFEIQDLEGVTLVYASTDDDDEERKIADLASRARIPVNIVDRPALSTFITPAQFRRGAISVAYSTGGKAPVFIRRLRAVLERLLPPSLGTLAEAAGSVRTELKAAIPDSGHRRLFWDHLFDTADRFNGLTMAKTREAILSAAQNHTREETREATGQLKGLVQLVGAGPGDPDLLTLRAHRALQQADVILYDQLVSREILSLARRDAEMIFVGKKEGCHGVGQDGIADLMLKHAAAGKRVVRLKSGDPLMFARVGEELTALRAAHIPCEIVPGVTAMSGIAASAQIPLTDRRWSTSLTLVTGHTKEGDFSDWARLAGKGQTLAVYMGLRAAPRICEQLINHGVSAATPVAIIENGTRTDERRFYTSLAAMPQTITHHAIKSPALLIIGDVVRAAKDWPSDQIEALTKKLTA